MTDKPNPGGLPATRKKYTPAFKAGCMRQVAAGARQTDAARAQGLSPALLGRWQRQALERAVPSSAERDEIKRRRVELKRVEGAQHFKRSRDQCLLEASALPTASVMSRYQFVQDCAEPWPAQLRRRVLGLVRPAITRGGAVPNTYLLQPITAATRFLRQERARQVQLLALATLYSS